MRKKWLGLIALTALMLIVAFSAVIYGKPKGDLTARDLQNPNDGNMQEKIAGQVLDNTGRTGQFDLNDVREVRVYFGNITPTPEDDAVVVVDFGPKNTLIAAYTPNGDVYEYIGEIGEFFKVENVQFMPVKELGHDVVIVNEYADQRIGAFEENSFIRGYAFKDDKFHKVLSTPENIKASWNQLWNLAELQNPNNWRRVVQKTESKWEQGGQAALNLTRMQQYQQSTDTDNQRIPDDETFQTESQRVVTQRYYWDDKYGKFILGEAVDENGNTVAVTEDFSASPYVLSGEEYNKSRIEPPGGPEEIVDNSVLTKK